MPVAKTVLALADRVRLAPIATFNSALINCSMAKVKTAQRAEASVAPETTSVRPTRFDPAHKIQRGDEPATPSTPVADQSPPSSDASLEAEALAAELEASLSYAKNYAANSPEAEDEWQFSAAIVQQFRTQANQLATHLETRQRELDRREAQFHAQLAKHESEARSARLWFHEHHHDLLARQASLEEQKTRAEADLAELEQRVAEQQARLQGAFMLPRELADKLSARSGELTNHDMELLRKLAKDHEAATQLALRQRQTDTMERVLQERTERLDAAALSLRAAKRNSKTAGKSFTPNVTRSMRKSSGNAKSSTTIASASKPNWRRENRN